MSRSDTYRPAYLTAAQRDELARRASERLDAELLPAMRDLVRARAAAVETLRVHRQQVSAFMLKHGRIYPRKKGWTMRYLRWLQDVRRYKPSTVSRRLSVVAGF